MEHRGAFDDFEVEGTKPVKPRTRDIPTNPPPFMAERKQTDVCVIQ
jgi:hypothetical protein